MARDRKRAKQRRDRARRTAGTPAATRARHDERDRPTADERLASADVPADEALASGEPLPADLGGGARADVQDEHDAPEPLDHASAEVDLAQAQLALGQADDRPFDGQEDDGFVAADELEEEADLTTTPGRAVTRADGRSAAAAREHHVPGNRVVGFLQASWRELQRVQWPDRTQVVQATGVVLGFCLIAGAFLGLCDEVFARLVDAIL